MERLSKMQRQPCAFSRQRQAVHFASLGKQPLSIWQSAVLAYASAKCGTTFTTINQTDKWLRINLRHPQHLTVKAACRLLLVEPPNGVEIFPPASPPTAS